MSKILFAGDPPMMDFCIIKLDGGENLLDMHSGGIYSLGSGELTKIITDAGMALNNTIEETLRSMNPNQSIRCQLMVHGQTGFVFQSPMGYHNPGPGTKIKFMAGGGGRGGSGNVITARPDGRRPDNAGYQDGNVDEVKTIIVVGSKSKNHENYVDTDQSNIRHATKRDNEDEPDQSGHEIVAD